MIKRSTLASCLVLISVSVLACDDNKLVPPAARASATTAATPPTVSATTSASATPAATASASAAPQLPEREIAGAAQILVTYKGADLADKAITRSKAEAKKRADEALGKVKKDKMSFDEAAKKYSDDERSKNSGGAIGNFEKNAMPEAFSNATFAMKVGDISNVVETPRGFHIIKRTK